MSAIGFDIAVDAFQKIAEEAFIDSEWGRSAGADFGSPLWQQLESEGIPKPEAFLSGRVVSSERCRNPVTGQEFHALALQTEAGTLDVVADLDTAPRRPAV